MAGAVDGDLRAAGLDGWGWVSRFLEGFKEVWWGGDEVWKMRDIIWREGRVVLFKRIACNAGGSEHEIIRSKLIHKRKETRESRLKKHIIIHIETHCAAEREVR